MGKLALQAHLCYNQSRNIVMAQQVLTHLLSRFTIRRVGSYRMDILRSNPLDSNPEKKCTGPCGRTLPATSQFFHAAEKGKYGLCAKCKDCRLAYQHQPEMQERKQVYDKAYNSQPENQERRRAYSKDYRTNPETREPLLAQKRAYYKRSDVKAHLREYRKRPEVRERKRNWRETNAGYFKTYRERNKEHRQAYNKAYKSRPEIQEHDRARNSAYYRRSETQERLRIWAPAYRSRPEVRERAQVACHRRRARKRAAPGTLTTEQVQQKLRLQRFCCYYCSTKFEKRNGKYVYHIEHTIPLSRFEAAPRHDVNYVVLSCPHCNWSKNDKLPHEWPEGGRLL